MKKSMLLIIFLSNGIFNVTKSLTNDDREKIHDQVIAWSDKNKKLNLSDDDWSLIAQNLYYNLEALINGITSVVRKEQADKFKIVAQETTGKSKNVESAIDEIKPIKDDFFKQGYALFSKFAYTLFQYYTVAYSNITNPEKRKLTIGHSKGKELPKDLKDFKGLENILNK